MYIVRTQLQRLILNGCMAESLIHKYIMPQI